MNTKTFVLLLIFSLVAASGRAGGGAGKKKKMIKTSAASKLPALPAKLPCPDLFIPDGPHDDGAEPYIETREHPIYASPSIWIQKPDGSITYNAEPGKVNKVCIRIKNRTFWDQQEACCFKVCLYWANASLGLRWPMDWNGSVKVCNPPVPSGGNAGCQTISGMQGFGEKVVCFDWVAPDPSQYSCCSEPQHFCLMARILRCDQEPFDYIRGIEGTSTENNSRNLNDISFHNITVVKRVNNNPWRGCLRMAAHKPENPHFGLRFIALDPHLFLHTQPAINLGAGLTQQWIANGQQGHNVQLVNAPDGQWIKVLGPDAYIRGFDVPDQGVSEIMKVEFAPLTNLPAGSNMIFNIEAFNTDNGELMGGEQYQIQSDDANPAPTTGSANIALAGEEAARVKINAQEAGKKISLFYAEKNIRFRGLAGHQYEISVSNANGQRLLSKKTGEAVDISTQGWATGLHLVQVLDLKTRSQITHRVVVQ